jgi:opacity protein-like surface antigen
MRTGRVFAAGAALVIVCLQQTHAAERTRSPTQPATTWTGSYIGAFLGRGWGDVDMRTDAGAFIPNTSYFTAPENIESVNRNGSGSLNLDEFVGGVQIGTSLQSGRLVFGFEADFGSFNIGGSKGVTGFTYPVFAPPANYTMRASMSTDWLATGRARIGWTPQSDLLLYATVGIAVTNLRVSNTFSDNAPSQGVGGSSSSETTVGWTLGAGGVSLPRFRLRNHEGFGFLRASCCRHMYGLGLCPQSLHVLCRPFRTHRARGPELQILKPLSPSPARARSPRPRGGTRASPAGR